MVDFQSRDTSRGLNEDDEAEAEEATTAEDDGADASEPAHDDHGHEHEHDDHHAHDVAEVGTAVVTVSSTRSLSEDPAGDAIVEALEAAGHGIVTREVIADDYDGIQSSIDALVRRDDVDAVVTTGGTGATPDDVTTDAAEGLFDKELPGFGELFRMLSYEEVGTRIVGTRATAGIVDDVPVFCLPGSENAARLGAEGIIAEEVGHLAGLAQRDEA